MKLLSLPPLGDLEVECPASWTAIADLTMSWPTDPDSPSYRLKYVRASAAAIGLVAVNAGLPRYRPSRLDLLGYGEEVLEILIPKRVQLAEIIRAGRQASDFLAASLPREVEVVELADFTGAGA